MRYTEILKLIESSKKRKNKKTILTPLVIEDDLNEIYTTGIEPENGAVSGFKAGSINDLIRNGTQIGKLSGYILMFSKSDKHDIQHYGLYNGNEFIAILDIHPSAELFPAVALTWTHPSVRGTGIMKTLFHYIVDKDGGLLSDVQQSIQAKGMWQSMIKNPPPGCIVKIWNKDENRASTPNNPKYEWSENPWGKDKDHLLLLLTKATNESCGKIVKGVNTTKDVGLDEITTQANKFGNKVSRNGYPPVIENMVNEINLSGDEPEDGAVSDLLPGIEDDLKSGKVIGEIGGFDLIQAIPYPGEIVYGLKDDSMVSSITLDVSDPGYPKILTTWTSIQNRGKGLMKQLFVFLVNEYHGLLSDTSQSTQAQGMWKSLIKNPPMGLKVKVWNDETDQSADYGDKKIPWAENPWDGSYHIRLLLTK